MLTDSVKEKLNKAARDFKDGKQDAFDEIFNLTSDTVFRICRNIVGTYHEAEDVMQEVYISVCRSLSKFREESSFFTWLYTIARNKSLNFIRKREKALGDVIQGDEFIDIASDTQEKEKDTGKNDELNLLQECIQELPESFRSIIVLRDIEGLSYEEIAEIEDIPVGTVRSRLHRSRDILKEMFFMKRDQ